ncbi:MAG: M23 family metallopeptidase [Candidatus Aminicenantes bacterium]|nr:M23 family metallopeptidase [Candidatus Aminicenantes bacterium]
MRPAVSGLFLFICIGLLCPAVSRDDNQPSLSRSEADLEFRALNPGEVVKATVKSTFEVIRAQIRFDGKTFSMGKGIHPGDLFALIGLDLGLKPGVYPVEFTVVYVDGQYERIKKEVRVISKDFPVKKLWVDERYVTPPEEVLQRIREESEILKSVYAIFTPGWLGEGVFVLPAEGNVVPNFGERRIFNDKPRNAHSGVDISSPSGTPVIASNSGKVVLASNLYFAGNTVIIDHGLGVFTLYCHFSKFKVKRGDLVQRGEIIGEVGSTGRVTGPHLHWAVKVLGARVDPFSLVDLEFQP